MSSSLFPLLYSVLLLCFSDNVAAGTTSFDFQTFASTSFFKFLGKAHLFENIIRLTEDLPTPNTGAGMVLYKKPIRFLQPGNPTPVSFTTTFSFTIVNLNPNSFGGGLAFVISANDETIGGGGGHLGIPTGAVAVEFDTSKDDEFKDGDGNHVGLNLGPLSSYRVADLHTVKVNLRSGEQVNSWIDYSGSTHQLNIYVSYNNTKPKSPVLSITKNLSRYLHESMFVGFSGSTQGSTEVHSLQRWSFKSSFDVKQEPKSPPPPIPTTVINASQPLTAQKQSTWSYLISKIVVGVMAAVAVVTATGGACYCIRMRNSNCCNGNHTSMNCCATSARRTMPESELCPIRKNAAVV